MTLATFILLSKQRSRLIISIPRDKAGLVLGKGGETIRKICLDSGASCVVDPNPPDGAKERNIIITGSTEESINAARNGIEQVLNIQSSIPVENVGIDLNKRVDTSKMILGFSGTPSHVEPTSSKSPGQTKNNQQWTEVTGASKKLQTIECLKSLFLLLLLYLCSALFRLQGKYINYVIE